MGRPYKLASRAPHFVGIDLLCVGIPNNQEFACGGDIMGVGVASVVVVVVAVAAVVVISSAVVIVVAVVHAVSVVTVIVAVVVVAVSDVTGTIVVIVHSTVTVVKVGVAHRIIITIKFVIKSIALMVTYLSTITSSFGGMNIVIEQAGRIGHPRVKCAASGFGAIYI